MSLNGEPEVRMLVSPCRSASSCLLQSFSEHPDTDCHYQPVKSGLRLNGEPDYSIFRRQIMGEGIDSDALIVSKETIGHSTFPDCKLDVFPCADAVRATDPIFLFRDPVDTWNSWANVEWGDLDLFVTAYRHTVDMFRYASRVSDRVSCVVCEQIGDDPEAILRKMCEAFGIGYHPNMMNWQTTFGEDSEIAYGDDVRRHIEAGDLDSVSDATKICYERKPITVPPSEVDAVNQALRRDYREVARIAAQCF